jgi:hypothetical protein
MTSALPVPELRLAGPRGASPWYLASCALSLDNQDSRMFSSLSNIWTGWLGMIVEMACL